MLIAQRQQISRSSVFVKRSPNVYEAQTTYIYGSRYTTWCHNAVANIVTDSTPAYISQCAFHLWIYMFLCEDTRSFNHFPIMLANSIARQLITGTVIPFHIHNVVAQLHQNGELRSAELFDVFWWTKFFRMLLQFSAKSQSSFLYFRWTFLCQPSGLFFDIQNFIICPGIFSLNSGRMPSNTAPSIAACRKHLTDLSLTKLFGNSVCKIWLRSSCFALGPPSILQTSFPNNFVGPVSNIPYYWPGRITYRITIRYITIWSRNRVIKCILLYLLMYLRTYLLTYMYLLTRSYHNLGKRFRPRAKIVYQILLTLRLSGPEAFTKSTC